MQPREFAAQHACAWSSCGGMHELQLASMPGPAAPPSSHRCRYTECKAIDLTTFSMDPCWSVFNGWHNGCSPMGGSRGGRKLLGAGALNCAPNPASHMLFGESTWPASRALPPLLSLQERTRQQPVH